MDPSPDVTHEREARLWAAILHASMLSSNLIPFAGFVVPIVIWLVKRDELPEIDAHGRAAANWMISAFLYTVGATILWFTIIGIPAAIILWGGLWLANIAFPVIAAVKAYDGKLWRYPATLSLL